MSIHLQPFRAWADGDPSFRRSLLFYCGNAPVTHEHYLATKRALDAGWRAAKFPLTSGVSEDWAHVPFGPIAFTVARGEAMKRRR